MVKLLSESNVIIYSGIYSDKNLKSQEVDMCVVICIFLKLLLDVYVWTFNSVTWFCESFWKTLCKYLEYFCN